VSSKVALLAGPAKRAAARVLCCSMVALHLSAFIRPNATVHMDRVARIDAPHQDVILSKKKKSAVTQRAGARLFLGLAGFVPISAQYSRCVSRRALTRGPHNSRSGQTLRVRIDAGRSIAGAAWSGDPLSDAYSVQAGAARVQLQRPRTANAGGESLVAPSLRLRLSVTCKLASS